MKRRAWYELTDGEQRVGTAQTFVWLSCAGSIVGLCIGIVQTFFGNVWMWRGFAAHPLQAARTLILLALFCAAGVLIGRRQRAGGMIALGLFAYRIGASALHGNLLNLGTLWAIAGIVLVLRAGDALNLPFELE